jgi:hypothetical protein
MRQLSAARRLENIFTQRPHRLAGQKQSLSLTHLFPRF